MNRLNLYDANKCYFIDGPGGTGKTYLFTVNIYINIKISSKF